MGTAYGIAYYDTARTVIVTQLNALKAQMVTDATDPAIQAVFSTHLGDPAITSFPAVSIGITEVVDSYPAQQTGPMGPVIDSLFEVAIRVMVGHVNSYNDEEMTLRVCNSILNWMYENQSLGNGFDMPSQDAHVEANMVFDDSDKIGGLVMFTIRTTTGYTAA